MRNSVEYITSPDVPEPTAHYSHATAWGDLVFVSGQLALGADQEPGADRSFEAQVGQALGRLLAILRESGCGPGQVLRVTAYLVGGENRAVFDRVYAEAFGEAKPARTVIPVRELSQDCLVALDAIGARHP